MHATDTMMGEPPEVEILRQAWKKGDTLVSASLLPAVFKHIDGLLGFISFYQEREQCICRAVGGVADNGKYRNDIIDHLKLIYARAVSAQVLNKIIDEALLELRSAPTSEDGTMISATARDRAVATLLNTRVSREDLERILLTFEQNKVEESPPPRPAFILRAKNTGRWAEFTSLGATRGFCADTVVWLRQPTDEERAFVAITLSNTPAEDRMEIG